MQTPLNHIRQTKFTAGEVDQIHWRRTDTEDYLTAAISLQNFEINTTGLAKKRKGTVFQLDVTTQAIDQSAMYEFLDNNGVFYVVVASDLIFNIFKVGANDSLTFYTSVVTPYLAADIRDIDWAQNNDNIVFTHVKYPPARLYISTYISVATFAYQVLNIFPQPVYDFGNINYNNFTVLFLSTATTFSFQFTGLGSDPGFNNDWVGGQIVGGGTSVTSPLGYGIIQTVMFAGTTTTFTGTVSQPFQSPGVTSGSQYSIRQPVFTAKLGYPSACVFYQNRLWLGGTPALPSTLFGSHVGQFVNYDVGTGRDTDAIVYTIGLSQAGTIVALNGGKQLEIFTTNDEFAAPQEIDVGLTPGSFSIRQQSAFGSEGLCKPITYLNDTYFVSKTGQAIMNYHFNGIGQTYSSSNVSVQSTHLVKSPYNRAIVRGADSSQDNYLYFLNPDNTITSFQFAYEYKFAALTPILFNEAIVLIDIVTVNNTVYILERIGTDYQLVSMEEGIFMDNAINSTMASDGVVTGLTPLEGLDVRILFDGQDFGTETVVGGQITVDNPLGFSGPVQVGLDYTCILTPLYFYAHPQSAYFEKFVTRIFVEYFKSLNFSVDGKLVPYQLFAEAQQGIPPAPKSGVATINPTHGYNMDDTFSITQTAPFDIQIISIGYNVISKLI
jgi:hypothetical protein